MALIFFKKNDFLMTSFWGPSTSYTSSFVQFGLER